MARRPFLARSTGARCGAVGPAKRPLTPIPSGRKAVRHATSPDAVISAARRSPSPSHPEPTKTDLGAGCDRVLHAKTAYAGGEIGCVRPLGMHGDRRGAVMSATQKHRGLELRQLPASARKAAADKAAKRSAEVARSRFSRTFADVLSGRYGGNWSVEWRHLAKLPRGRPPSRDRRVSRRD